MMFCAKNYDIRYMFPNFAPVLRLYSKRSFCTLKMAGKMVYKKFDFSILRKLNMRVKNVSKSPISPTRLVSGVSNFIEGIKNKVLMEGSILYSQNIHFVHV